MISDIAICTAQQQQLPNQAQVIQALLNISPKRSGTYFEAFSRKVHGFDVASDVSHDACIGDHKIELKTSRVIIDDTQEAQSLWDQLITTERTLCPFHERLNRDYNCNIQQIKTSAFDTLYYSLFFQDVIIECSVSSVFIRSLVATEDGVPLLKTAIEQANDRYRHRHPDATVWLSSSMTKIKQFHEECHTLEYMEDYPVEIVEEAWEHLRKFGYSDKQHAGNEGEGQFHIKSQNVDYHIQHHGHAVYSYQTFQKMLS